MTSQRQRIDDERGSATVWVVALAGVLALVGAAVVLFGAAVVARHRATSAADLAALAGAGRAVVGAPDACAAVVRVATANQAMVDSCVVQSGAVVEVRLHVDVRLGPLGATKATARARAGPAPATLGGASAAVGWSEDAEPVTK
jgi:secretion/DNA translocation related TadE-like protein